MSLLKFLFGNNVFVTESNTLKVVDSVSQLWYLKGPSKNAVKIKFKYFGKVILDRLEHSEN